MKGWEGISQREITGPLDENHMWLFRCPQPNCRMAVSGATEADVKEIEANHKCPHNGGVTHYSGGITLTLVEDMWHAADLAYSAMQDPEADAMEIERRRGRVRGICDMIAIFSPPHFRTSDEVGRELLKRSAMSLAGETYDTPGLGSRIFEMPSSPKETQPAARLKMGDRVMHIATRDTGVVTAIGDDGVQVKFDKGGSGTGYSLHDLALHKSAPISAAVLRLKDTDIAGIKFGVESGFSESDIAKTYSLTPADVKQVLSS